MDAGHIFGRFTKLTPLISDYLGSNQSSDNINTYPQFKSANEKDCKDDHDYGQLHFEREALILRRGSNYSRLERCSADWYKN